MLYDLDHYMSRDYMTFVYSCRRRGDHYMAAYYWNKAKFKARLYRLRGKS